MYKDFDKVKLSVIATSKNMAKELKPMIDEEIERTGFSCVITEKQLSSTGLDFNIDILIDCLTFQNPNYDVELFEGNIMITKK